MELDFLTPISNSLAAFVNKLSGQQIGNKIKLHTAASFPELNNCKVAIVGVLEKRTSTNEIEVLDLTEIRKQFYSLYPGNWSLQIADLGDVPAGNTKQDSFFAVQKIVENLIKINIIPVVLGFPHDITYPMYRAYDQLDQMVNLVTIDSKFDIGKAEEPISPASYLSKIIIDEPNNLFNYCNIGYQIYYNPQEEIDLIEKLNFDAYRLGEISTTLSLAEPVLRDADLVSIDLSCMKSSCSGNFNHYEPNGFSGKEICALARYAGISDKVTALGLFNFNNTQAESSTISQMLWYFTEGVNFRWNDYPFGSKENYSKFIVTADEGDVVFWKSNKSGRWWIELSFFTNANNKLKKITLLPCSHEDYLSACNTILPERWWKAQYKNAV